MSEHNCGELKKGLGKILLRHCNNNVFSHCNVGWIYTRQQNVATTGLACVGDEEKSIKTSAGIPLF